MTHDMDALERRLNIVGRNRVRHCQQRNGERVMVTIDESHSAAAARDVDEEFSRCATV